MNNINNLSKKELLELRNKIDYKLMLMDTEITPETIIFYDILSKYLIKNNYGDYPNLYIIKKKNLKLFKKIVKVQKDLDKFLNLININLSKINKIKYYNIIIKILILDLETWCSINLETILNNMTNFKNILEKNFPMYLESGVLNFLINKKEV
jgi:hypothetical protein